MITTTLRILRDTAEQAVLSQITINSPSYMKGFRESSSVARRLSKEYWSYAIDDGEVLQYMITILSLNKDLAKINTDIKQFDISQVKTRYLNAEGGLVRYQIIHCCL